MKKTKQIMTNKKYSLTKTTKKWCGVTLFQIKAEKDFGNISKGELGGYIEKEENLDNSGNAWVSGDAQVYGDARVSGDAQVSGNAWVSGGAQIYGDAQVSGNAWVSGGARVSGNAWVSGDAQVSGNAWVSGDAQVYGDARVSGDAQVSGNVWVSGNAWVYGGAQIYGDAQVYGKLKLLSGLFFGFRKKEETITFIEIDDYYGLISKGDIKFGEEEPEIKEITMDEIAQKFGVDVKSLKIKK